MTSSGCATCSIRPGTDPQYGKFLRHEPARAKVEIALTKDRIAVKILDMLGEEVLVTRELDGR